MNEKLSRFIKTTGPEILFASTAIGVSHLIQSTRDDNESHIKRRGISKSWLKSQNS